MVWSASVSEPVFHSLIPEFMPLISLSTSQLISRTKESFFFLYWKLNSGSCSFQAVLALLSYISGPWDQGFWVPSCGWIECLYSWSCIRIIWETCKKCWYQILRSIGLRWDPVISILTSLTPTSNEWFWCWSTMGTLAGKGILWCIVLGTAPNTEISTCQWWFGKVSQSNSTLMRPHILCLQ